MSTAMIFQQLAGGMLKSISIFCWTLLFSLPLGLLIAFGRMSRVKIFGRFRIVRGITKLYIDIMRGTPLMLQLMVVFYGPFYLWGADIGGFRYPAIIIAFSINYAAYFAEIYRSGIESMPKGQYEAAEVLGYTKAQTFVFIILPQVIKRILPAVTNEMVTLVKDTSLAFSLAYMEMFTIAKQIAAKETTFVPFAVAAIFYFVFNWIVSAGMTKVEEKLNYYR
ncbi:MAG: amino acid ABC transporter permease [Lachnospiraceae bacterium]|nr:amino acid ABC transporter permease [Lachnospiraceae bacterium]MDD7176499.1 amino acid ABC transporter permease [bacterium]MDY5518523.1 amino acid ABC transporter permease [Lachnospiraceae bacterium]